MSALGLNSYETEVYLALLKLGSAGVRDLTAIVTVPRNQVYHSLTRLAAQGIVTEQPGTIKAYSALPPQDAFARLVAQRNTELERIRAGITGLGKLFNSHSAKNGPNQLIEVIRSTPVNMGASMKDRTERIAAAREEVLFLAKSHAVSASWTALDAMDRAEIKALRRGVRFRCVFEAGILDDPRERKRTAVLMRAGEQGRVVRHLPLNLTVVDRATAWFRISSAAEKMPVYKFNDFCVVEMLVAGFERFWAQGSDVAELLTGRPVLPACGRQRRVSGRLVKVE
jgi:sugar-specific transcriptional regulator TrmB